MQSLSLDAAAFYNSYTNLIYPNFAGGPIFFSPSPLCWVMPMLQNNGATAQTHGLELSAKWQATHYWMLSAGVSEDRGTGYSMMSTPRHEFTIQTQTSLPKKFELDSALYHSSRIRSVFFVGPVFFVPTSNRVDVGLSWQTIRGLRIGLWGRNLQAPQYREGHTVYLSNGDVRRSVVVKAEWEWRPERRSK